MSYLSKCFITEVSLPFPSIQTFYQCRPLHLAAALTKVPEIADLLLEGGAEVDARNRMEATPLSMACEANNPYAASKMIVKGELTSDVLLC